MKNEDLNLNLLKTFYHVAKEGNITKTAEKYYTSQPSISRAIKQLEDSFGTQLFYRTLTGVELTEKGSILFESVEKIFQNLNQSEIKIKELDGFESGRLYIGVPSQIGGLQLFEEMAKFHNLHPKVDIMIVSKTTTQLLDLLEKHEVDFVIDTAPIKTSRKDIEIKHICDYDNCFFVGNKFAQSNLKQIKSLKELNAYPIILPIPHTANRDALDAVLQKKNFKFDNVLNIHTSEMIISAVKKGTGIGYAIKDLILDDIRNGEVTALNIEEKLPKTEVCLVYKKSKLSKISIHFLENFLKIKMA